MVDLTTTYLGLKLKTHWLHLPRLFPKRWIL